MKCVACNAEISADAKFCPVCGVEIEEAVTPPETENIAPAKDRGKFFGTLSVIFGAVSFFFGILLPSGCLSGICAILGDIPFVIMSLISIVFGVIGRMISGKAGRKNPRATAGLVLGISGIAFIAMAVMFAVLVGMVYFGSACTVTCLELLLYLMFGVV